MSQLILVADDERKLLSVVQGYLEQAGFRVATAATGREALMVAREQQPDLIVLDLMMPEMDGYEFMRQYRRFGTAPIIVLTALDDDMDKVVGLEMGADDYMTKPFSPREMVARVRAVLRRSGPQPVETDILRLGDLVLDRNAHEIIGRNERIELTPMEFGLLDTLMSNPGRAFTRYELLERAQGFAYDGYERTVDVHIKNLRKKIEPDAAHPTYILTVYSVGYRFNPDLK
ncbi:MAG: response regulator transcription factor [Anaerolineae bacterium]|nr:response regulator transcription factor [Anaerolineae bacterium]MCO5191021.1 response regulator transcription factor [Anaerolineae bacterium]MCO5192498.1 response regulator transcription factor [Anaerolineae bacterium]MCO5199893.1 response regulator transcription factor [Anaerolineae bacterium]MCO5207341.1 response regulator transcription factor [Anaerolineae bacterium]